MNKHMGRSQYLVRGFDPFFQRQRRLTRLGSTSNFSTVKMTDHTVYVIDAGQRDNERMDRITSEKDVTVQRCYGTTTWVYPTSTFDYSGVSIGTRPFKCVGVKHHRLERTRGLWISFQGTVVWGNLTKKGKSTCSEVPSEKIKILN